jgi:hypothetical protein
MLNRGAIVTINHRQAFCDCQFATDQFVAKYSSAKCLNKHMIEDAATNSASIVERVTIGCFLDDQDIVPDTNMKI